MKVQRCAAVSLLLLLCFVALANAQTGFNAYFGIGSAFNGSTNQ